LPNAASAFGGLLGVLDVFVGRAFAGVVVGFEAVVDGGFCVGLACDFPAGGLAAVPVVVAVVAGVLAVVAATPADVLELEPEPQPAIAIAAPIATKLSDMRFQIFKPFSLHQNVVCTF
jgi:hypothetical protein